MRLADYYSIIIKNPLIGNFINMKNFNNEEIQKYQKMTRDALNKVPKLSKIRQKISYIRFKHILASIFISGATYLAYRIYEHNKYRNEHYIDIFQWKSNLSNSIRRKDLFDKLINLSFTENIKNATESYQKALNQQFYKITQRISEKGTYQSSKELQSIKQDSKKRSGRKKLIEIILTKNYKSNLDLGYVFKLHTKQYMTTITNQGEIIKKTYITPIIILGVPFFGKKKQQVSKIRKNKRYSNVIEQKNRFDFSSECQKINYWNTLFMRSQSINSVKQERKHEQQVNPAQKREQNVEKNNIQRMLKSNRQKKQLLYECRNKIRLREQKLVQQLKHIVEQYWRPNSKNDNNNFTNFSLNNWENESQKQ